MKTKNEPEKIETKNVVEKTKRERVYFDNDESELTFLTETYRKILRIEPSNELKTMLKEKIEQLERELRLRVKLKTAQQ